MVSARGNGGRRRDNTIRLTGGGAVCENSIVQVGVLVGNVRLERLGQVQLGHRFGVHVSLIAVEQGPPDGLTTGLLQGLRLFPIRRHRQFHLQEHLAEYVVALSVAEHGAHHVRVHPSRVLGHNLDSVKNKKNR